MSRIAQTRWLSIYWYRAVILWPIAFKSLRTQLCFTKKHALSVYMTENVCAFKWCMRFECNAFKTVCVLNGTHSKRESINILRAWMCLSTNIGKMRIYLGGIQGVCWRPYLSLVTLICGHWAQYNICPKSVSQMQNIFSDSWDCCAACESIP